MGLVSFLENESVFLTSLAHLCLKSTIKSFHVACLTRLLANWLMLTPKNGFIIDIKFIREIESFFNDLDSFANLSRSKKNGYLSLLPRCFHRNSLGFDFLLHSQITPVFPLLKQLLHLQFGLACKLHHRKKTRGI